MTDSVKAGCEDWQPIESAPEDVVVLTKIDDEKGVRNEQPLVLSGRLWWFADKSMYVYYGPTHWRMMTPASVKVSEEARELMREVATSLENAPDGYSPRYSRARTALHAFVASLEADRRRMDWLEKDDAEVTTDSANITKDSIDGTWYVGDFSGYKSLREAIDAALTTQQEEE